MFGKCAMCGKELTSGYQLIAIDGAFESGKVTSLEPVFNHDGKRLYKNYFVHRECVQDLLEFLRKKLDE